MHTRSQSDGGILLCVVLLVGSAGCAGRGPARPGPDSTLRDYRRALEQERYEDAYRLMSASYRRQTPFERFRQQLVDARQRSPSGAERAASAVRLSARAGSRHGEALVLVEQQGSWSIGEDPTELYAGRTPRQALRSFVRALSRQRYDVALRFAPSQWAGKVDAAKLRAYWETGEQSRKMQRVLRALQSNLGAPIRRSAASRAEMRFGAERQGGEHRVELVEQDGRWRIVEIE